MLRASIGAANSPRPALPRPGDRRMTSPLARCSLRGAPLSSLHAEAAAKRVRSNERGPRVAALYGMRGRAGAPICAGCAADFFPADAFRCSVCAERIIADAPACGACLAHPPHFDSTTALADHRAPVDGMITALKFGGRIDLAGCFGRLLAARDASRGADDLVIAVPLSFERESERGFNQSREIARSLRAPRRPAIRRGCTVAGAARTAAAVAGARCPPAQRARRIRRESRPWRPSRRGRR